MKCFIITIHHIHNFGSIFQAYALARFLQLNGYNPEIIDYRPGYYKLGNNKLKTIIGKILNLLSYHRRKKKFEHLFQTMTAFQKNNSIIRQNSRVFYPYRDNIFIIGCDQLWNDRSIAVKIKATN